MKFLKRYAVISLGSLLFAAGFAWFWDPAGLAPGGVSGMAVIITHFLPFLDSGLVILLLNLPLLMVGAFILGGKFLYGTIWATLFSSAAISALEHVFPQPLSDSRWFCAVSGATLCGIGIGLVFREDATTGGTDIAVRLLGRKFPRQKPGVLFLFVDALIVAASGLVFRDFQTSFYSGIALLLSMAIFQAIQQPRDFFLFRTMPSSTSK